MLITSPQALAEYLYSQRKQQALNQTQAADRVGLKQATLSKLENRPATSQIDTLFRMLSALELEMHIAPIPRHQPTESRSDGAKTGWTEEW